MRKSKWKADFMPLEMLALKLVEEAGEVAKEFTKAVVVEDDDFVGMRNPDYDKLDKELKHVEMIVKRMRVLVKAGQ